MPVCDRGREKTRIAQGLSCLAKEAPAPKSIAVLGTTGIVARNRVKLFQKAFRGAKVTVYDRLGLRRTFEGGRHDLLIFLDTLQRADRESVPLTLVNYMSGLNLGGRLVIQDFLLTGPTLGLNLDVLHELGVATMSRQVPSDKPSGDWIHILTRERESDRLAAITQELAESLERYEEVAGEY